MSRYDEAMKLLIFCRKHDVILSPKKKTTPEVFITSGVLCYGSNRVLCLPLIEEFC